MVVRVVSIILFFVTFAIQAEDVSADQKQKNNIDELFYKNSLFHYYSGDYISALTKTLINDEKNRDPSLNTKNKLLLGGIYLAYGLDYDAKSIFDNLNDNELDEEIRNIIWFYIGRDFYNNFDYSNSEYSLEKITANISDKNNNDRINILSNVYVYTNNIPKLEKLLTKNTLSQDTRNYLKFNLGIAHLRSDDADKGKKYLTEVANIKPLNTEQISLRDKAKLHLANLAFKLKDYKVSIKHIDEMDSQGIFSESAIYLSALSHSISGNTKKAFSLLNSLKKRDSKNIYKYYSILLIARILEQNNNLAEALQVLNNGVTNIQIEKQELNTLLDKIRNNFFLTDLSRNKVGEVIVTNQEYKNLVNDLVFSRDFSGLYNHYIDLIRLQKTINHWNNQIPEFYIMLKERDTYFKEKKSNLSIAQYQTKKGEYLKKAQSLKIQVDDIKRNKDLERLYTEDEAEVASDLEHVSKKIVKLSQHEDLEEYSEKTRIMKGLNYWNAASQYHPRLWEVKSHLKDTENEIITLDQRIVSLQKAAQSKFNYTKHKNNVDSLNSKLHTMDTKLVATISRLKEQLIRLAAAELDNRYKDIDAYYRAFRFDVARVSDRIVLSKEHE